MLRVLANAPQPIQHSLIAHLVEVHVHHPVRFFHHRVQTKPKCSISANYIPQTKTHKIGHTQTRANTQHDKHTIAHTLPSISGIVAHLGTQRLHVLLAVQRVYLAIVQLHFAHSIGIGHTQAHVFLGISVAAKRFRSRGERSGIAGKLTRTSQI